jgi:hypothetical protein
MKNQITVEGDVAHITLSQGYFAVIDAGDVEMVSPHRWWAWVNYRIDGSILAVYALTGARPNDKQIKPPLHRFLMDAPNGLEVDHIDRNGLNNRRSNLRIATHAENQQNQGLRVNNTSGFKGVNWHKPMQKWRAYIQANGKLHHLGLYSTPEDAARAYDTAAITLHGDFARLNAPAA